MAAARMMEAPLAPLRSQLSLTRAVLECVAGRCVCVCVCVFARACVQTRFGVSDQAPQIATQEPNPRSLTAPQSRRRNHGAAITAPQSRIPITAPLSRHLNHGPSITVSHSHGSRPRSRDSLLTAASVAASFSHYLSESLIGLSAAFPRHQHADIAELPIRVTHPSCPSESPIRVAHSSRPSESTIRVDHRRRSSELIRSSESYIRVTDPSRAPAAG